jgi:hypothetical protein
MEEKIVSLKVNDNIEQTSASVKSLRTQLREAQQEVAQLSDKFGATSKEAVEAAKRAAQLKDAIGDAKALTDAFNPDAKFKAVSASLTGVAGGFSAVTGAMGLFGKESEEVEQAILKVQSAMALASGIQAVGESIDSFKQLGAVIRATTIFQKASAAAQWLWNAAMAANPIGAIVAAVTALIAAGYLLIKMFVDSSEANEAAAKATAKNTAELERNKKAVEANSKKVNDYNKYQYDLAKASGASAEQLRKLALKHKDEEIALNLKNTMIARSTFLRERDTLAALRANDASDEVIKNQEKLTQDLFKEFDKQRQGYYNSKNEKVALIRSQVVEERQAQTDGIKKAEEDRKKAAEKAKEDAEKAKAKREKDTKDFLDKLTENAQKEKDINQGFIDEQTDALKSLGAVRDELLAKENNDLIVRGQMASTDIAIAGNTYKAKKELSDREIADIEAVTQARIVSAQAIGNAMGVLSDIIGKETAAGKAMGIAQALINTYIGASEVIKQKSTLPSPFDVITKVANVATILATGFSTVRQLTKVQVPGRGAGGGGGGASASMSSVSSSMGASAASAPQFNVVGTSGALASQVQSSTTPQAPIKAFVVSNDVTTAQSLDRNIVKSATLG